MAVQITKTRGRPAREEAVASDRRRRTEFGLRSRTRLGAPLVDDAQWKYRWVNDTPGRIAQLTGEDWDVVERDESAADHRETSTGSSHERHAGTAKDGKPIRAVLMRKPMDFYKHDKGREQGDLDRRMTAVRRGRAPGEQGEKVFADGMYVPAGGITIQENRA